MHRVRFGEKAGASYICCHSDINDVPEALRPLYNFTEPPVCLDYVYLVSLQEMREIKEKESLEMLEEDLPF